MGLDMREVYIDFYLQYIDLTRQLQLENCPRSESQPLLVAIMAYKCAAH